MQQDVLNLAARALDLFDVRESTDIAPLHKNGDNLDESGCPILKEKHV